MREVWRKAVFSQAQTKKEYCLKSASNSLTYEIRRNYQTYENATSGRTPEKVFREGLQKPDKTQEQKQKKTATIAA